jgi:rubrerythrin
MTFPETESRQKLIELLQLAYSGELAAAHAYRGHWKSVRNPAEKTAIQNIEADEWRHRRQVGEMLASLGSGPNSKRETRANIIGRTLGFLCHVTDGWRRCMARAAWRAGIFASMKPPRGTRARVAVQT